MVNGNPYTALNDIIQYSFTFSLFNDSAINVTISSFSDDRLDAHTCNNHIGTLLQPGEVVTCAGQESVSQSDIDAKQFTNTATVSGVDSDGRVLTHSDSVLATTPRKKIKKN